MSEVAPRATRRIGHKGADHIAPGNTLASFDAGLAAGDEVAVALSDPLFFDAAGARVRA